MGLQWGGMEKLIYVFLSFFVVYMENNILRDAPILFLYVCNIFVMNTGSEAADLVTFLVFPKMSQKVLQDNRESKLAIWEELPPPKKKTIII